MDKGYVMCIYTYIHIIEYFSAIKMNEILRFAATLMDLEGIMLSEMRDKNTLWYHLYVESKKI